MDAMSKRPLLDSFAVPVSVAGCVASAFMIYKVAMHEKAPAAASFTGFCLFTLIFVMLKAKSLSHGELTLAGVSTFVIASVGTLAAVNGIY